MLANSLSKANDAAISTDAPESNDQVATENPATEPGTDSDASQQDSGSSTNETEPPVTDNNNNSSNDNSSQERETEKKSDDADRKSTERDRDRNRESNSNNTSVTPPTTPEKKPDDHTTDSGTTNNGAHDGQTGTTPDTTTPPDGQQPDGQQPDPNTNTTTEPPKSGEIAVPNLVGLSKEEAEKQVLASGLKYEYVLENSDEQEAGKVFKQEVPAGGAAKKGDKIKFYVSRAKK